MQRSFLRISVLLTLVLPLIGCTDHSSTPENQPEQDFDLRVYRAPEQNSGDMARIVQRLLAGPSVEGTADQSFFGRVQTLPNGDLAVFTLESVHDDLERLFAAAEKQRPGRSAADLQFWLIRATPSESTVVPDRLSSLEQALVDVAEQTGPVAFELIEHLRQRADINQQQSTIHGADLYANSRFEQVGEDRLFMDMNLRAINGGPSVMSDLTLEDRETVLLAQTGSADSNALFLFVVRVDLL